jgi:phosphatidylserine/phosphatidylglycerophosphate/cardiolipin synthase-like enzyme
MPLISLPILNDHEYHTEVLHSVRATRAGDRIAIMTMSFEPSEEITAALMQELIAAAKRKVHVTLVIDAISLMVQDMIPVGPLYTLPNPIPKWRLSFNAKFHILNELRDNGGSYCITNIPERPLTNPFAGRSHIKFTVINDTAYLGGCNLSKTWGLDLMMRLENKKTVDWMYDFILSVSQKGNVATALEGKDLRTQLDKETDLLIDAGRKGQSLIYKEALDLIDGANDWIVLTCQFFPGRSTAEHIVAAQKRGVTVTVYFDPIWSRAPVLRPPHWIAERQERNKYPAELFEHRLPKGLPRLHAKLIATEQGAMIGSHNYVVQGVAYGTAEAAILRKNPQFSKKAVEVFTKRLAEVTD